MNCYIGIGSKNLSEEIHSDRDTTTSDVEVEDIDQQFLSEDSAHDIKVVDILFFIQNTTSLFKYYDQQSNYSSDSMTFLQMEHIIGHDCETICFNNL